MPQQPKFKDCVWDSAKDPYTSFRTWLCVFGGIVANYNAGPQLESFLDLFLVRDPQAATTQPSFLSDPRLSLGEPSGAHAQGSNVTRHPSPLSMGGRSEATGETLGSEVRSTTSHYDGNRTASVARNSSTLSERCLTTTRLESPWAGKHLLSERSQVNFVKTVLSRP